MDQNWSYLGLGKNSTYFENNFPIFLLFGNSNTTIFKVCGVLHWLYFFVMKVFPNIFHSTFCSTWANNIWIYFISIFSVIADKNLFTLRASLLISSSNEIADDEGSFEFSSKAEFTSPLHVRIILATDTEAEAYFCAITAVFPEDVETFSIQMFFKRYIAWKKILRGHVDLIICLN